MTVADGKVVSEGLRALVTSFGGDKFQLKTVDGVECFAADKTSGWLRVVADPPWPAEWTGPATIGLRYYDNQGPVRVQFDCADPARNVGGAWAYTPIIWRTGSSVWETVYFTIEKPAFRHRMAGADFGLTGHAWQDYDPLYVAEVTLSCAGVVLSADARGLALGDELPAKITAKVFGPDGKPAADGTSVRFEATLGLCDPEEATVAAGEATTTFAPYGQVGEVIVRASCQWSSGQMALPLVEGTGGVEEIEWVVEDFEALDAATVTAYTAGAQASAKVSPEGARSGLAGAVLTYDCPADVTWCNVGFTRDVPIPGALLGMSFWAKMSEPALEICWAAVDANGESWLFTAATQETGENGWRRFGSTALDPYSPWGDAVLDYPLGFHRIVLPKSPWSQVTRGTLCVDDIVARLLVAGSEVARLKKR